MYAENEKISYRQMKRLIVFDLFSVGVLVVPRLVVSQTGYDGIPALIIGTLLAIGYAVIMLFFMSQISGPVYNYSEESVGKVLSFIIGLLYIFKLLFSCVVMTQLFSTVINLTLLSESSKSLILIPLILVSGYEIYKGDEARARLSELLYYIILAPFFILLLFGLKEIDLANLTPVFASSFKQTMFGSYLVFMVFNIIEFVLFLKPYVKKEETRSKDLRKTFCVLVQAIVIAFVFFLLFFVLTVGILGMTGANQSMWSTINIFQIVELPGSLINRQDSIMLGLWVLTTFTLLSGFIFYLSMIMKDMFCIKHKNKILPFILVILILCSMIPIQQEALFQYYLEYMKKVGIPQSLIIPLVLIIIHKIRGLGKKKVPKTMAVIVGLLLVPMILSGCNKHVEIEDRDFVQVVGLDMENGKVVCNYVLPDLGAMTDQGSATDPGKLIRKFTGDDYIEIEEQYKLQSEKRLDYSHLKAIILGKEFASDHDKMRSFLDYAESNYQLSKKTLVFLSDDKAETIVSMNGDLENGVGTYLESLYKNNLGNSQKKEIILANLIQVKNNLDQCIFLPVLELNNDRIFINGEAVMYQGTVMLQLNAEESIITDIVTGYGENARLFTKSEDANQYVVTIRQIRKKFEIKMVNGKPSLNVTVTAIGGIEKGLEDYQGKSYSQKAAIYEEVEELLNEQVKERVYYQFDTVMKNQGVDYLNIFRSLRYKNPSLYRKYKDNQKGFLKDLEFNINVSIDLID